MNKPTFQTPLMRNLTKGLVLVLMVAIIVWLFPHKSGSFTYRIEEGKPWSYGLVTAPFDFPIYKSTEQLASEEQELLRNFAPYFTINPEVSKQQISEACQAGQTVLSANELNYLQRTLTEIYQQGIMSVEDMRRTTSEGYQSVTIVNSRREATAYPITYCHTPRSAYDLIVGGSPLGEMTQLGQIGLNRLLLPNLAYDSITTGTLRNKLLANLTESQGIVQKGEKIVDRGEIINSETARILHSLKRTMAERGNDFSSELWSLGGSMTLVCLFVVLMTLYLMVFRRQLFEDISSLLFFTILMTGIIVAACLVERYTKLSIYIVPFAWVPIITRVFFDSRTALYLHMVTTLICAFVAPAPFEFMVLQMAAGMIAVSSLKDMAQRSQLVQTAVWILLTYCLCYTAFILAAKGSPNYLHWHTYIYFLANALLVVFSYGLIYLFERAFGLVSSITLVELTNINSDLMLEFAERAPGTFQHSLQVSNLAMEAAKSIGANALLVRTGALYHDIGKMAHPENFTENQSGGQNPLLAMSCENAAQAVIAHITDGITLAQKHHLPEIVIQFIGSHHGNSMVRYFYNTWCNTHPGETPNESLFRYSGPRPSSKETAILMMADAVEARSRSLKEYTEDSIRLMVDQMVSAQLADGQFESTPLTFRDLEEIKAVFVKKLVSMNHHRIAYPELQNKQS